MRYILIFYLSLILVGITLIPTAKNWAETQFRPINQLLEQRVLNVE